MTSSTRSWKGICVSKILFIWMVTTRRKQVDRVDRQGSFNFTAIRKPSSSVGTILWIHLFFCGFQQFLFLRNISFTATHILTKFCYKKRGYVATRIKRNFFSYLEISPFLQVRTWSRTSLSRSTSYLCMYDMHTRRDKLYLPSTWYYAGG